MGIFMWGLVFLFLTIFGCTKKRYGLIGFGLSAIVSMALSRFTPFDFQIISFIFIGIFISSYIMSKIKY